MNKVYNVVSNIELGNLEHISLVNFYQPLFAYNALALYISLLHIKSPIVSNDLIKLTHDSYESLALKRSELERFGLVNTYEHEGVYTLVMRRPLCPCEFLNHAMFGRLYTVVMGHPMYSKQIGVYGHEDKIELGKDVSAPFDAGRLAAWNESFEDAFVNTEALVVPKEFDVVQFFRRIPDLLFPVAFRTKEVRDLIEDLGSRYRIDHEKMMALLMSNVNSETGEFNRARFISAVESSVGRMDVDPHSPYAVDPLSFLRYKQGFDFVGTSDVSLLQSLTNNFGFNQEVVNFLVEYVLETNEGNLARAYVEKIASTWKRNNVTTIQEARNQVVSDSKPKYNKSSVTKMPVPIYSKDTSIDEDENEVEQAILRMLKKGDS
jgi:replication initiation and membrane attachment protein